MLQLSRNGLRLQSLTSLDESQGSSNVKVSIQNDGTYTNYSTQLHYGYYVHGFSYTKGIARYENGFFILPREAFEQYGLLNLSVLLVSSDEELMTNQVQFIVQAAPRGDMIIDDIPSAQQQVLQLVQTTLDQYAQTINLNKNEIAVLKSRMDSFTSLQQGSTTGDAELIDGRVGFDGIVYENIGGAIRSQINKLHNKIDIISENTINLFDKISIKTGYIDDGGSVVTTDKTLWYSEKIDVQKMPFTLSWEINPSENLFRIAYYNDDSVFVNREVYQVKSTDKTYTLENAEKYRYVVISAKYGCEDKLQLEIGNVATEYVENKTAIDISARKKIENIRTKKYDVCIIGGGAGGIGSAYALKDSGLRVCLIEQQPYLGGTHTQGGINSIIVGANPEFFDEVLKDQIRKGQACLSVGEHQPLSTEESLAVDWIYTHKVTSNSYNVIVNPKSLSLKYYADLSPYIDIMLSTTVIGTNASEDKILSVETDNGMIIYANQFIDCSAQSVVLSQAGVELLCGGDSNTRYKEEYGFTEVHAPSDNYSCVNSPTLIYKICKGSENLEDVYKAWFDHCAYTFYNENPQKIYINSFDYITPNDKRLGDILIENGIEYTYNEVLPRLIQHWKTIKSGFMVNKLLSPTSEYKYDVACPMLGIRELYRVKCERMLHESDLYVEITPSNINSQSNNLDKFIAVGGGGIDVYSDDYITDEIANEMNSSMPTRYGIPYGCIIPKTFKNILVASRGMGVTHIASSACRLTKTIIQLGFVAGKATIIMNEDELQDYRNVDVNKLQSSNYTNLVEIVDEISKPI